MLRIMHLRSIIEVIEKISHLWLDWLVGGTRSGLEVMGAGQKTGIQLEDEPEKDHHLKEDSVLARPIE